MNRGRRPTFSIDASDPKAPIGRASAGRKRRAFRQQRRADVRPPHRPRQQAAPLAGQNVRQFLELRPGKIVAISNAAGRGVYNRMILIDEDQREARWVIDSARDRAHPGQSEVIALTVHGQIGFDVYRVPIP